MQYVFVSIEDDNIYEASEEFFGRLITSDSSVVITEPRATVIIADNDGEPSTTSVNRRGCLVSQASRFSPVCACAYD